jgi:hypothetical protein
MSVLYTLAAALPTVLQTQQGNQLLLEVNADDSCNPSDPEGVKDFAAS